MDTKEYCVICQECGGDLSFVIDDEVGDIRVEPCGSCLTEPEVKDEIKGVCTLVDCEYKNAPGCRVYGLGVKGITECIKYKLYVKSSSRRKVMG